MLLSVSRGTVARRESRMAEQPPILNVGPVSGRVYIVTRYRVLDAERGRYEALEKFDVTKQFEAVVKLRESSGGAQGAERG